MTNYFTKHLIISLLSLFLLQPLVAMEGDQKKHKIDQAESAKESAEQIEVNNQFAQAIQELKSFRGPFGFRVREQNKQRFREIIDRIKHHLAQGANPEIEFSSGKTLLCAALENHYLHELCEPLLRAGADANQNSQNGENGISTPPLLFANNNLELIRLLLSYGADINKRDSKSHTALFRAVSACSETAPAKELVLFLLNQGADARMSYRICERIDDSVNPPEIISENNTILMHAARHWLFDFPDTHFELLDLFLTKGIDIESKNSLGKTALMLAAGNMNGNHKMRNYLLSRGANPNVQDNQGNTVLIRLAERGASGIACESLLQYDADPEIQNNDEQTALDITNDRLDELQNDDGLQPAWAEKTQNMQALLSNPEKINAVRTRRENNPPVEQGLNALRRRYQAENLMHALQNRELGE